MADDPRLTRSRGFAWCAFAGFVAAAALAACARAPSSPVDAARRLADEGRHEEAAAAFDAILSANPGDAVALTGWCRSMRRLGRVDAIATRFPDAEAPGAPLALGLAAIYAGDAASAESHLARALGAYEVSGDRMAQATALSALGILDFYFRNEPARALERIDRATTLARAAGDDIATAEILNNRANALIRAGDSAGAEAAFVEADRLAARHGFDGLRATLLTGLGNVKQGAQDWDAAIEAFGRARGVFETRNDSVGLGQACLNMAIALQRTGRYKEAIDAALAARAAARAAGDRRLEARTLEVEGNALVAGGDIEAARVAFTTALERLAGVDAQEVLAAVWTGLGNIEMVGRDLEAALTWYWKSLESSLSAGDAAGEAISRLNLGSVHIEAGRWAAAAAEFDRAAAIYETDVDDLGRQARALVGLARVDEIVGNAAPARQRLMRALDLTRRAGDRSNEAVVLSLLAYRDRAEGDAQAALARFDEARRLLSETSERPELARATLNTADTLRDLGRLDEAGRRADEARRMLADGRDPDLLGLAELALARISDARGEDRRALGHLERADRLLADAWDDEARVEAGILAGRIHERRGEQGAARTALEQATRLEQGVLDRAGGSDLETGVQALTTSAPRALALLLVRAGDPKGALEALEGGRARALRRSIGVSGLSEADDDAAREWRQARVEVSRLTALLRQHSAPQGGRAALLEGLDRAERDADRALRARESERGRDTMSFEVDAEKLQARLAPGEALLVSLIDDPISYLWLMRRDGIDLLEIAGSGEIRPAAEILAQRLEAGDAPGATAAAERLGALATGSLAARWSGITRLYLVPDDVLWRVPFQALRVGTGQEARFVAEVLETDVLPAAALLPGPRVPPAASTTSAPAASGRQNIVVAFGDPRFGAAEASAAMPAAVPAAAPAPARAKWQLTDASVPRLRSLAEAARGLEALPASATEVRAIQRLYPPGRSIVLVRGQATEAAFKSWTGRGPAILHVASHALTDERVLGRSALVFAADTDGVDDGLLTVGEIAGLRLHGSLVVLSACRTAGHRVVTGEGMQGLARAFLAAGAGAVVATQWPIEDRAAAAMMTSFHRGLAAGRPAGRALNDARLALMRSSDPALSDPSAWAAFVLVGDGRLDLGKR